MSTKCSRGGSAQDPSCSKEKSLSSQVKNTVQQRFQHKLQKLHESRLGKAKLVFERYYEILDHFQRRYGTENLIESSM